MRPCLTVRHGRHAGTPGPSPGVPVRASVPGSPRLGPPKARPRPAQGPPRSITVGTVKRVGCVMITVGYTANLIPDLAIFHRLPVSQEDNG